MTFAKRVLLTMVVIGAGYLAAGCVQVGGDEPLVRLGDKDLGGSSPNTTLQSDDSDEVRALKDYAAKLEDKLDDKEREFKEDLADEKDRRKKVEDEKKRMENDRNYWKKRAEQAEDALKDRR